MTAEIVVFLRTKWDLLLTDNEPAAALSDQLFHQLILSYSQSHRAYHNLSHLYQVFLALDLALVKDAAVNWAVFFHDYAYVPGSKHNEIFSAREARRQLTMLGFALAIIERVEQLILATVDHRAELDDELACVFLDADMSILGCSEQDYDNYKENIRCEFAATPSFLFTLGRRKFLGGLLRQKKIFLSDFFHHRFEIPARKNIQRELGIAQDEVSRSAVIE